MIALLICAIVMFFASAAVSFVKFLKKSVKGGDEGKNTRQLVFLTISALVGFGASLIGSVYFVSAMPVGVAVFALVVSVASLGVAVASFFVPDLLCEGAAWAASIATLVALVICLVATPVVTFYTVPESDLTVVSEVKVNGSSVMIRTEEATFVLKKASRELREKLEVLEEGDLIAVEYTDDATLADGYYKVISLNSTSGTLVSRGDVFEIAKEERNTHTVIFSIVAAIFAILCVIYYVARNNPKALPSRIISYLFDRDTEVYKASAGKTE